MPCRFNIADCLAVSARPVVSRGVCVVLPVSIWHVRQQFGTYNRKLQRAM